MLSIHLDTALNLLWAAISVSALVWFALLEWKRGRRVSRHGRFPRLFAVCLMAVVIFPSISDSDDLLHFSLLQVPNRQSGGFGSVGMMGFGSRGKVHHKRLFGVSDDKPVIITVVDEEHKIREVLPESEG